MHIALLLINGVDDLILSILPENSAPKLPKDTLIDGLLQLNILLSGSA